MCSRHAAGIGGSLPASDHRSHHIFEAIGPPKRSSGHQRRDQHGVNEIGVSHYQGHPDFKETESISTVVPASKRERPGHGMTTL
ncbi:hypothetical protein F4558_003521 [Micromonospora profundi]|nr:hypothetical protein [Micromonospora profundi]